MIVPNRQALTFYDSHSFDAVLNDISPEDKGYPAVLPVPAKAQPEPASAAVQPEPGPDFQAILRANLHAAAQHAALGHAGPSFRECSRPACRNASNLVPYPVEVQPASTGAALDEVFNRMQDGSALIF